MAHVIMRTSAPTRKQWAAAAGIFSGLEEHGALKVSHKDAMAWLKQECRTSDTPRETMSKHIAHYGKKLDALTGGRPEQKLRRP